MMKHWREGAVLNTWVRVRHGLKGFCFSALPGPELLLFPISLSSFLVLFSHSNDVERALESEWEENGKGRGTSIEKWAVWLGCLLLSLSSFLIIFHAFRASLTSSNFYFVFSLRPFSVEITLPCGVWPQKPALFQFHLELHFWVKRIPRREQHFEWHKEVFAFSRVSIQSGSISDLSSPIIESELGSSFSEQMDDWVEGKWRDSDGEKTRNKRLSENESDINRMKDNKNMIVNREECIGRTLIWTMGQILVELLRIQC